MAIKVLIDKLEDVPEQYRDLYTEKDGKFELTGIEGMKTQGDIDRLQSSLVKERNDHKITKQKFAVLGDRKPEEIIAILDRVPELEAAAEGKLDDAKIEQIVSKRIDSKTAPLNRQIENLKREVADRDVKIGDFVSKEKTRTIHDAVREAVAKAQGFQPSALEDALMYGDRHFEINEEGKVVTKDGVGVTPGVDPVVWLGEMQTKKAHWWGETKGGGAGGSGRGTGMGNNPFARATWNLTEQGKLVRENRARAENLAKAAGTTIGGPMPAK
jgi:hypothetical protein